MATATEKRTDELAGAGAVVRLDLAPVEFLAATAEELAAGKRKGRRFRMSAYTGATILRWWGSMVIDLDGIEAGSKTPILMAHDDQAIVGFSDREERGPRKGLVLEGVVSEATDEGRTVAALADEGFPWQASVGVAPLRFEEVLEGASAEVNGRTVQGPITIIRACRLLESSFVIAGADGATSAEVMSARRGEWVPETVRLSSTVKPGAAAAPAEGSNMDEKARALIVALSVAQFAEINPKVAEELRAEGEARAREALKALKGELPAERVGFAVEAFLAGKDPTEALADLAREMLKAQAQAPIAPLPTRREEQVPLTAPAPAAKPGDALRAKHGLPGVGFNGAAREGGEQVSLEGLPFDERVKLEWERLPLKARAEWGGKFEAFRGYARRFGFEGVAAT